MTEPLELHLRRDPDGKPVPLVIVPDGCPTPEDLPEGAVRVDLADLAEGPYAGSGWHLEPARSPAHTVLNLTGLGPELRVVVEARKRAARRLPLALEPGETRVLGRAASGTDWVLEDPAVSRRHLELSHDGVGVCATDLGSTSGTKWNGEALPAGTRLRNGDELELGDTRIRFYDPSEAVARFDSGVNLPARAPLAAEPTVERSSGRPRRAELVSLGLGVAAILGLLTWLGLPLVTGGDADALPALEGTP